MYDGESTLWKEGGGVHRSVCVNGKLHPDIKLYMYTNVIEFE